MPFLDTDEAFWDRVIEINFKGCLRMTQRGAPGHGRARVGADRQHRLRRGRVGSSLEAVYSGAKGGVIAFTKTIAREVARSGVTANTRLPGPDRHADARAMVGRRTRARSSSRR